MRFIRFFFLGGLSIVLIAVALANRSFVTLRVLPEEMAGVLGLQWSASLPLFLVIFASIVAGVAIGFVWEWLREHKHRAEARSERRERERLEREVSRLSDAKASTGDDVLAMLEAPGTAR
jgi:lipopolysaccharide assembly protein A